MANIPDLRVCGYPCAEYYKNQVLRVCTKGDPLYVGTYEAMYGSFSYPYHRFQIGPYTLKAQQE